MSLTAENRINFNLTCRATCRHDKVFNISIATMRNRTDETSTETFNASNKFFIVKKFFNPPRTRSSSFLFILLFFLVKNCETLYFLHSCFMSAYSLLKSMPSSLSQICMLGYHRALKRCHLAPVVIKMKFYLTEQISNIQRFSAQFSS